MIAKGQTITEQSGGYTQYHGFGVCSVLAVNPTKEELEKNFGIKVEKEPEYTSSREYDGVSYNTARITFYVKPTDEKIPVLTVSFNLTSREITNRDKTKKQIIDRFGRTAWVTNEDFEKKNIPLDRNGNPLRIDADYRPCISGEENLTKFIKTFLGIPNTEVWNNDLNKYVPREDLSMCLIRLDTLDSIINKGDLKEIKEAMFTKETKDNLIKIMFGARQDPEGRMFQSFYPEEFLSGRSNEKSEKRFMNNLMKRKEESNTYSLYYFDPNPIHEFFFKPEKIFDNPDIPANIKSEEDDLPF